jgi:broad specificity phosphatase PhoE
MSISRLNFVSHAATEAQRRAAFPLDEPILENEIAKMTGLTWKVPASAHICSAPEQRAQQTCRMLGLSATVADGLRDCNYGRWRGQTMDAVETEDQEGILAWLADPSVAPHGGESLEILVARVGSWMDEQRAMKHTIAVTHPAIIRAAIVYALQIPVHVFWRIDVAPLTVTDLRFNNNVWTLRYSSCPLQKISHETDI